MDIGFSISSAGLLNVLLILSGAVEKKQDKPILSHILFEVSEDKIDLSATDRELECIASVKPLNILKTGSAAVPAKKLIDICRALTVETELNFSFDGGKLVLKAGKSRFCLSTLPAEEFPILKTYDNETKVNVSKRDLLNLFQSTFFCMAQQDVRYFLNGLLIETEADKITSVSTDGHRLALCDIGVTEKLPKIQVIVPRKAISEFIRLLSNNEESAVSFFLSDKNIILRTEGVCLVSRLIDGTFPTYQAAFPKKPDKTIVVDKDALKQSLAKVSVLANEKAKSVKLTLNDNRVLFSARNQEKDEALDEISAVTTGEEISIGLNVSYFLDVLNTLPEGEVCIAFSTPDESILITSQVNTHCRYVIMPIKI